MCDCSTRRHVETFEMHSNTERSMAINGSGLMQFLIVILMVEITASWKTADIIRAIFTIIDIEI